MLYRTININNGEHGFRAVFSFCFFLVFLISFTGIKAITAPGDSTKQKYDINDPRNPDCPCHKYQKLAEDEYNKLQKKEKKKPAGVANDTEKKKDEDKGEVAKREAPEKSNADKKERDDEISMNKKHHGKRFYKAKCAWSKKFSKRFHSKRDPSSCYHWT
jgi:hypothetical protein